MMREKSCLSQERNSCPYIEGGLTFQNHGITACCAVRNGHEWPLLYPYDAQTGPLPLEDILKKRREIQLANAENGYPACKGCRTLTRRVWEEKEYPFDLISVQNDLRCNIICEYCNFLVKWDDYKKTYKTYKLYPIFKQMIEQKLLSPHAQFFWAGGEPSILDEFEDCLELIFGYSDQIHLQIATNATNLSPRLQNICRKYGDKINILCSLDSGSREVYLAVKKRDYFEQVVENLKIYTTLVKNVFLKMIITETNYRDIDAFLRVAQDLKIRQVFYDIDCTQNMQQVPQTILEAVAYFGLRALSYGLIATPASLWQFYDLIAPRFEPIKAAQLEKIHRKIQDDKTNEKGNMPLTIQIEGKNKAAFANEAYILNLASNEDPILMNLDHMAEDHIIKDAAEAPTGKALLMVKQNEKIELIIPKAKILYLWAQCSPWGGIINVQAWNQSFEFDLYTAETEHRIFVLKKNEAGEL